MRKIIILSSVLLIIIAFLAVRYFSVISVSNNNNAKVLKYIPYDAAVVMSFNNDESFYDIFRNYELFNAVLGESRASELTQLKTLLLEQPAIKELTQQQKIFVSFHPQKADSVDMLFSMALSKKISPDKFFSTGIKGVSVKSETTPRLYSLKFSAVNRPFFLFISDDLVSASFSKDLLLRVSDPESRKISQDFVDEIDENSSKKLSSPVSLFVNHTTLPGFLASFTRGKPDGNSALLKKLKGISSLNMNFKHNALMFNGISTPDTSELAYLNLFLNQRPVLNQLKNLLPDNTANSILFAFSDYKKFHTRLLRYINKRGDLKRLQSQIKLIRNQSGVNIETDIKPFISNEFALIETKTRENLGIVKLSNGTKVNFTLKLISQQASDNIARFNNSNLLYYYFGDPFKSFVRPYFTVIDNYLIVSNSQSVIQNYLNDYSGGRFISKTKEYAEHDQLVANKSNILYFINTKNSEHIINRVLKKGYAGMFANDHYEIKNFYGLSWQWSSDKNHFQVNLYANYLSNGRKELKPVWKFKMNARIGSTPWILKNGDKNMVLVQDNVNNLYALSEDGKRLWAYQIDGGIEGSVHQLSDGSILFNTSRNLYHIEVNGTNRKGFPAELPFIASAGMTLSSSNVTNTRIFIPAQTTILAYDISGKVLPGWNKPLPSRILSELRLISSGNSDYLAAGTTEGKFFFFNQKGEVARKIEITTKTRFKNPVFVNPGKPELVTTDTSGTVYFINIDGTVSEKETGPWSPDHKFIFANVSSQASPEFIYFDKSQLNVFNQDGSPVYTYSFEQTVKTAPQLIMLKEGEFRPAFSSPNNMLFLFEEDGNLFRGFPVKGTGNFNIGYLRNDGIRYLLSGTYDNLLQAYKM
ncbi:DUF3352 domain-containing protein [Pararcticibacter amylolyticus]|uniref:Uncharacterized protein n=1 Tax=Pararcticibacter amylolyticus TaxID=2173175 RepID=A0A2U2PHH5_9SPHI|nr:DUF3352 domain-containing protein [Pararcticibacter amylolyticus]PWG80868.1 hypothetical protein DDR33_10490 [Pararcticibacter amylolyticus]